MLIFATNSLHTPHYIPSPRGKNCAPPYVFKTSLSTDITRHIDKPNNYLLLKTPLASTRRLYLYSSLSQQLTPFSRFPVDIGSHLLQARTSPSPRGGPADHPSSLTALDPWGTRCQSLAYRKQLRRYIFVKGLL